MVAQDTPFIYHPRSRAVPSSSGWYMNSIYPGQPLFIYYIYMQYIHIPLWKNQWQYTSAGGAISRYFTQSNSFMVVRCFSVFHKWLQLTTCMQISYIDWCFCMSLSFSQWTLVCMAQFHTRLYCRETMQPSSHHSEDRNFSENLSSKRS